MNPVNLLMMIQKCGTPGCSFLKPQSNSKLDDELTVLYSKLVDLGMEYRDGRVYLVNLEDIESKSPPKHPKPD